MATAKELQAEVAAILATKWQRRDGTVVPDTSNIKLGNDAADLDGTVLYADLADSTGLVNNYKDWFAAEVYKAYLVVASRIIRNNGGEITAFDGDRVMAVFLGNTKNTNAARTGLQINWAVSQVINPALKVAYSNSSFQLKQRVGIDSSKLMVARTGIRGSNDLVWVGRAANYAAKLAALSDTTYPTVITDTVFARLSEETKLGGSNKQPMWEKTLWTETGLAIYRSNWTWSIA
ncbi:adenylate/guanylate cyclase domain-containing protein [Nitrospira lenta]|uniref:Adenylate/guanylate cyclase n=1 Tax=Nitrospira lenta TaxID=1436998 RepID=A0A330LA69_9BACT|nr:adenylate/guanylate cyclase domain-containing protein [Nitrospira lenta]SPP65999.1 Adenylate/guanylate cyclase [Nitrospira lenta]